MSWLRIDDSEALDSRIGSLTDAEYRGRHALMQLVAREYRDTGIFPAGDVVHAVYATEKGPRKLTRKSLERLRDLDLIRARNDYTTAELLELDIEWPAEGEWLRIHNWEKYNPPRDRTAAERKRRQRHAVTPPDVTDMSRRDSEGMSRRDTTVPSRSGHGVSRAAARARPRPVPVNDPPRPEGSTVTAEPPQPEARPPARDDDFGPLAPLDYLAQLDHAEAAG